jgi:hypothetical protein
MQAKRCAVLCLLFVGAIILQQCLLPNDRTAADAGSMTQKPPILSTTTYFRSGQWRADARTLVAALDYLLAPENGNSNPGATHA